MEEPSREWQETENEPDNISTPANYKNNTPPRAPTPPAPGDARTPPPSYTNNDPSFATPRPAADDPRLPVPFTNGAPKDLHLVRDLQLTKEVHLIHEMQLAKHASRLTREPSSQPPNDTPLARLERSAHAAKLSVMVVKSSEGEFTPAYWQKLTEAHEAAAAWAEARGDATEIKPALFKAAICRRLADASIAVGRADPAAPAYWGGVRAFFEACKEVAFPTNWLVSEIAREAGRLERECADAPFVKSGVTLFGARHCCQMCDGAGGGRPVFYRTQMECVRHVKEAHHASDAIARRHAECVPNVTGGLTRMCGLCNRPVVNDMASHLTQAHQIARPAAAAECERMYSDELQACLVQAGPDLAAIARFLDVC